MNREIKFRAWEIKKKEWHYFTVPFDIGRTVAGMSFPLYYENWCQYTGLKDKNGKEIYEKDLVRCGGRCMDERKYKESRIGMMDWSDMHRGYVLFLRNKGSWCYPNSISYVPDTLEVIGNIWENPDLINEV